MAGYLGSVPVPQATQHRETFTATAAQTSFATAGYTPQFVDVYLNGVHLSPADVTATNGSDVVLTACLVNDIVDVVSYTPFEVADQTFTGTTTTDVSLTTGVLTANGGAVFNEGSADVDFRVESNANINMLFVDGGGEVTTIGGLAGATSEDAGYFPLQVGNTGSGATILQMLSAADAACTVHFGDAASGAGRYDGYIQYNHNTRFMNIGSGANNTISMNADGIVSMPRQPAFLAHLSATQENLAVGGSETTVKFDSEIFDQNGDFTVATGNGQGADSNNLRGAFTAPVTGKYQLNFNLRLVGVQNDTNYLYFFIKSSNRNYTNIFEYSGADDAAYLTAQYSMLVDMDASDTAFINAYQSGGAAETDIEGGASNYSFFSGYLVA